MDLKELLLLQPRHGSSGGLLKHRRACSDPRWSWTKLTDGSQHILNHRDQSRPSLFLCCPSPRPLIKLGPSSRRLVLSPGRGGSCSEPITIQNGFSRTEKNSCLYYLNASPLPAPLIGSLITGRGARRLIRNRLLVR